MKFSAFRGACFLCLLIFSLLAPIEMRARHLSAAKRDHLTAQEIEMVREAQELDKRTAVFVKAAERRLSALTNPSTDKKEIEKWGELKGTRADFLSDLSKILDEAITNIDDVSARDERNPLVPKALRTLSEASIRIMAGLAPLRDQATGAERNSLESAIENAEAIIEAAGKLPPPPPKSNKKKDNNKQST